MSILKKIKIILKIILITSCLLLSVSCEHKRVLGFEKVNPSNNSNISIVDKRLESEKIYSSGKKIFWGDNNFTPPALDLFKESLNKFDRNNKKLKVIVEKFKIIENRTNFYIPGPVSKDFLKNFYDIITMRTRLYKIECNFNGSVNNREIAVTSEQYFQPRGTYPGILGETKSVKAAVQNCLDHLSKKIHNVLDKNLQIN